MIAMIEKEPEGCCDEEITEYELVGDGTEIIAEMSAESSVETETEPEPEDVQGEEEEVPSEQEPEPEEN